MGRGDDIMAAGEARWTLQKTGRRSLIVRPDKKPQWSDLWNGLPYIVLPESISLGQTQVLLNGPGARPYIADKSSAKWTWKPYIPKPAEICFTNEELTFAWPFFGKVMIEPNVKNIGHTNKDWGFARWQALVDHLKEVDFVQCLGPDSRPLAGVQVVMTPTFRQAAAVLQECSALVTSEGGLHHAAAAVSTPAVVIRGEFISPQVTGYTGQRDLWRGGHGLGCGMRVNCPRCRAAMASITVAEVAAALLEILG